MRSPRPRHPAALLLAATCLAGWPSGAAGGHSQETIFDASTDVFEARSAGSRIAAIGQLDALGTDVVRIVVPWRFLVPNPNARRRPAGFDPSNPVDYPQARFAPIDDAVRAATDRGMRVLLTPSSPIPDWASRHPRNPGKNTNPKPGEFRNFVTALGIRYSGLCTPPLCFGYEPLPRVSFWSVMNEPNLPTFLQPSFKDGRPFAPGLYRKLFLAAKGGLSDSGHPIDQVLIGETSPGPGRTGIDPVAFMRGVLCLDRNFHRRRACRPLGATGWAHHPYDPNHAPFVKVDNLVAVGTLGRLTSALNKAKRAGATRKRWRVYVTEFGVESVPDSVGVSEIRQAEYQAIGEFLLWRNPHVRAYGQYLLTDNNPRYEFGFETGLRFFNGRPKVSYEAFPIALVVRQRPNTNVVEIWGHVRPRSGPYKVEIRFRDEGGAVRTLANLSTDPEGYFRFDSALGAQRRWRAVARLSGGRLLKGPFVRSYKFR